MFTNEQKAMKNDNSSDHQVLQLIFSKSSVEKNCHFVVRSIIHRKGLLSVTLRKGIITCLSKGDKPRQPLQKRGQVLS